MLHLTISTDADVSLHVLVMRQAARHGSGTFTSYRGYMSQEA
jgi:hypothetical protein